MTTKSLRSVGQACRLAVLVCPLLVLGRVGAGQQSTDAYETSLSPLHSRVDHFDVEDGILEDGVSELSLKKVPGLHLGLEVVIRENIQDDPRAQSPHFSLHLENPIVGDILDELCVSDMRYTWSEDGATINIYPRATEDDESYLLNLRMDKIEVKNVPDPDQALTPLSKKFPEQQIGYFGPGLGSNTYVKPWTTSFENLTVRQFANRLAEQMGPDSAKCGKIRTPDAPKRAVIREQTLAPK